MDAYSALGSSDFYPGTDLGATWKEDATFFRVWAPTAQCVTLRLYLSGDGEDRIGDFPMERSRNGTWTVTREGDLHGVYYTYLATVDGDEREAADPYGKAAGVNGKRSMVIDLSRTDPDGWEQDRYRNGFPITDAVICEVHVRDFSIRASSRIRNRGKYLAFTEDNTSTKDGHPTGTAYLRDLGITHVQLMPIYDFGSVDESRPASGSYNWGYDPENYNLPEGSYSSDPYHGEVRVRELKAAIQALHSRGIGVIMDVVYNHVYRRDDFSYNKTVPGYFSRGDSNGSYCGNDTATERPMVRKFLVDSVRYWVETYHIDGFRLDLAGLIDTVTVNAMLDAVHSLRPDVYFYGEGWEMPTVLTGSGLPLTVQRNAALVPGFGFFNDRMRDGIRGSTFDLSAPGYVTGGFQGIADLIACFLGRPFWAQEPGSVINYISCHDDHTLADRIATVLPGISRKELARRSRLAAAFNLLAQGVPFFLLGEEALRSKPNGRGGFVGNSYRSPDRVNSLKWESLSDPDSNTTRLYYRGLIALRKAYPVFRLSSRAAVDRQISLFPCPGEHTMAFLLEQEGVSFLVFFHPDPEPLVCALPQGSWEALVWEDQAGTSPLENFGSSVVLPPLSATVLRQRH